MLSVFFSVIAHAICFFFMIAHDRQIVCAIMEKMSDSMCYHGNRTDNMYTLFLKKKNFYKKMSPKNPKTLRKCSENLQPQMPEVQFLKTLIFTRTL